MHSYSHKSADEYKGKKVLVVGACTAGGSRWSRPLNGMLMGLQRTTSPRSASGRASVRTSTCQATIGANIVRIDVTMYQRSPTYVITVKTVKEAFMKGAYTCTIPHDLRC